MRMTMSRNWRRGLESFDEICLVAGTNSECVAFSDLRGWWRICSRQRSAPQRGKIAL